MSSKPTPEGVATELERKRALSAAHKNDRLQRIRDRSERRMQARAIRQEAARDRATADLERAKIAADIAQSAEARALRVQRTRTLTLWVLLPVLAAFAAWSTAGVHAGAATMTGAADGTAMWWALWLLEPALLGTVAWIILCRSRLASSGGRLGEDADRIMWGCLAVSVVLNAIGHWPDTVSAQGIGRLIAHSLGPIGAAMTAHLIGVIERAITTARPSQGEGVKSLTELTETTTATSAKSGSESASHEAPPPARQWVSVPPGAWHLPIVARSASPPASTSEKPRRSKAEQREHAPSEEEAPAGRTRTRASRADKGATLPKSLKSASEKSARALSDEDLAGLLDTAITDARLSEEPSVSAVQKCLGVGFDRAKRVMERRASREGTPPDLAVVGEKGVA